MPLTSSYVKGATDTPLLDQTIGQNLAETVARYGDNDALIVRHQNIRWTYSEFADQVRALAAGLLALGLRKGDRIGIWAHNYAEWTLTQFATAEIGIVLVNINPAYRLSEVEYALQKVGVRALITADQFKTSDYIGMINELVPGLDAQDPTNISSVRFPDLKILIRLGDGETPGMMNFSGIARKAKTEHFAALEKVAATLTPDDPINIQFTSGTTGFPKGATLTHRNILNNGYFAGEYMKLTAQDRLCIPVPLYHCFGMVLGNLACVTHGATMIYPEASFDPVAVMETVAAEQCTALHGVPTMFIAELDHPDFASYDYSTLRTGIMAGAPCPIEVMKKVVDQMHMTEVTIAYGMTETSPVSFQSTTDDPLDRRVSTVGRIHPHVEVKVVNEAGQTVPPGVDGELVTRGYSVMLGYWGDEERTKEAIDSDGWMHTGDQAVIDEEGYCNISGRIKDMIIRGGENVYPREIEEYLFRNDAIQDVQVFGVPDERYGEEICAWIQLRDGQSLSEEDVKEFCRGQIAHYKVPRYVVFVDEFPMTVTGKAQKFVMRDKMVEDLGLVVTDTA